MANHDVVYLLLALVVVLLVTQVVGRLLAFVQQPPVMGEMLGGILLGPSFLGLFFPDVQKMLLPDSTIPFIGKAAQLGVVLYMFVVGLELDLDVLKMRGKSIAAIPAISMILPFLLGLGLAPFLFPTLAPPGVPFASFMVFVGVSMCITAFPVLARILADLKLQKTELGSVALACAALDDATAWCLLALAVSIAKNAMSEALQTFVLSLVFVGVMVFIVRPLVPRFLNRLERSKDFAQTLPLILIGALVCSIVTEYIGIHTVFGAFLLGVVMSPDKERAENIARRLNDPVKALFLPLFFAYSGLRTQLGLLDSANDWLLCALIIFLATLGKVGGTFVAARFAGFRTREATALGVLMNTRGLVELIVLNIGLDLGLISPRLFAMMVVMALATTLATSPVVIRLLKLRPG